MNITVFSHYFAPEIGAPSARIYDLAQQWLKSNHEVQVVTCFPNHPTGTLYPGYCKSRYMAETIEGIKVHRHWTYLAANKGFLKKTLGHLSFLPSSILNSEPRLARPDVTIGTSPTFFAAMASNHAARRSGVPHIMEVRDLWPAAFVELGVLRNAFLIGLLERWELMLYRQADQIVVVTDTFRQNLVERGVPAEKVVNIPNGADEQFWQPACRSADLARRLGVEGKFIVLYIGAHGISQALRSIIDGAGLLRAAANIRFLFVGEGAEKSALVRYAQESGLPNVCFLDPVSKEEVKDYYSLADVCLVPLRDIPLFKTFIPSKMFEMMAMERPIVASVGGEAAGILRRSGGAVVVPPEDSAGIAGAIRDLATTPERCSQLGRAGRRFVVENYSRRSLARKYVEVIEETQLRFKRARQ